LFSLREVEKENNLEYKIILDFLKYRIIILVYMVWLQIRSRFFLVASMDLFNKTFKKKL
jgi:hypothetical protein